MKSFPMFFRTTGRRVVIVGGGEQAAQKARLLLKTDAALILIADRLDDELSDLVQSGRAAHLATLGADAFDGAAMAFVATGCPAFDAAAHGLAQAARCPVNVVDRPDLCDITTPAIVDRDPIVVAIGSEGTAPVLTREIRSRLETMLPQNLGGLAALGGRLRPAVARAIPRARRRAFWAWVFNGTPRDTWTQGAERDAAAAIKTAIAAGGAPDQATGGRISLVGAGPGARDLLTLRAIQRMQEADVIFFDRLVDKEVLELARRDAERVFVGKHVGAHAWPQDRINAVIVANARQGRNVVRLKSGDPGIFGRAGEELAAAREAGIPVEIVPGVTAASAAAASFGRSLTERGVADTLILATGTGCVDNPLPDCIRHTGPGSTTALYMAARQADRIASAFLARGFPGDCIVEIGVDIEKAQQRLFKCTMATLSDTLKQQSVSGCAVILVTWPSCVTQRHAEARISETEVKAPRQLA